MTCSLVQFIHVSAANTALLFSLTSYHQSFKGVGGLVLDPKKVKVVQLPGHLYCTHPAGVLHRNHVKVECQVYI